MGRILEGDLVSTDSFSSEAICSSSLTQSTQTALLTPSGGEGGGTLAIEEHAMFRDTKFVPGLFQGFINCLDFKDQFIIFMVIPRNSQDKETCSP